MTVFIYSSLQKSLKERLSNELSSEHKMLFSEDLKESERQPAFQSAEVVMGNPPAAWFQPAPSSLRFWQLDSAGFDQYKHLQLGATVANMGDFFAIACAETIVGGVLSFYRGIHQLVRAQMAKEWIGKKIRPSLDRLSNKRVMILGAGTIGQQVKKMLTGFSCQTLLAARTNPAADLHTYDEILAALPEVDVVINTLPGSAMHYVTQDFFEAMHPGSVYASVGRGSTTDEKALLQALGSGKLAGAVLDVTEQEPLPGDHPLWTMSNVVLTQHSGGGYKDEDLGKVELFLKNFKNFVEGRDVTCSVQLSRGY